MKIQSILLAATLCFAGTFSAKADWYTVIKQIPNPSGVGILYVAVERNTAYDSNPNYYGNQIGQFSTQADALSAAQATLANSH